MGQLDNDDIKKVGGLKTIIQIILNAFKGKSTPQPPLPPTLILTGSKLKSGLSSQKIAARIISRQKEAGAPFGNLPDGSDNISEQMEIIRVEEIINALLTEGKIQVVINPGIPVVVTPVTGVGETTMPGTGSAQIS